MSANKSQVRPRMPASNEPVRKAAFPTAGPDGRIMVCLGPDEMAVLRRYWAAKGEPLMGAEPAAVPAGRAA